MIQHTTYTYLSTEKLVCFLCKEEGHVAEFCKNQNTSSHLSPDGNSTQNGSLSQGASVLLENTDSQNQPLSKPQNIDNSTPTEMSMPPPGTKAIHPCQQTAKVRRILWEIKISRNEWRNIRSQVLHSARFLTNLNLLKVILTNILINILSIDKN